MDVNFVPKIGIKALVNQKFRGASNYHIITLYEPESKEEDLNWIKELNTYIDHPSVNIWCHDIDQIHEGYEYLTLFNKDHALEIINSLNYLKRGDFVHVLTSCCAGISRSAAVAKFIATIYHLPFNHKYSLYNKHIFSTLLKTYEELHQEAIPEGDLIF